jgi:sterol 24-C-methyltransferase
MHIFKRRNISYWLMALAALEICFWTMHPEVSLLANAHDVHRQYNDRSHQYSTDLSDVQTQEAREQPQDTLPASDDTLHQATKSRVVKETPPSNTPRQCASGNCHQHDQGAESLSAPQETSEDGSNAEDKKENEQRSWSLFGIALAVLALLGAHQAYAGVKTTMAFGSKLSKAKQGGRYDSIDKYNDLQDDSKTDTKGREESYATLVSSYYDLATEFYEWGWGQSFHFADRRKGETFATSIVRHEHYLAGRLGVAKGAKLLDCGCGVGGPARNIAEFTGAHVTGITINEFQVGRGNTLSAQQGVSDKVNLVQGDFMKLPFEDNSFDGVYAIEATCHAPDRVGVYSEILRVLKPGGVFATYEWCLTDKFDRSNPVHMKIKKDIEEGDGLPDMCHTSVCTKAVETVGFELLEARDCALDGHEGGDPWERPLTPSWCPWKWPRFQFNPVMFFLFPYLLSALEMIRLVPVGTSKTQVMLQAGGIGCEMGGATGTFTPMWLMVGRKPLK